MKLRIRSTRSFFTSCFIHLMGCFNAHISLNGYSSVLAGTDPLSTFPATSVIAPLSFNIFNRLAMISHISSSSPVAYVS